MMIILHHRFQEFILNGSDKRLLVVELFLIADKDPLHDRPVHQHPALELDYSI